MRDPDKIVTALDKVVHGDTGLTPEELKAVRDVLEWWRTWKAWGKLGRIVLWCMITLGAVAAAAREVRAWLGQ